MNYTQKLYLILVTLLLSHCTSVTKPPGLIPTTVVSPAIIKADLKTVPCDHDLSTRQYKIQCYQLFTSASRVQDVQQLALVRLFDLRQETRADPIIYLTGGPGGSTGLDQEGLIGWLEQIKSLDFKRDWILFEQRGIGQAKPSLSCPNLNPSTRTVLSKDLSVREELRAYKQSLVDCRKASLADVNWSLYTTQANVEDVIDLMHAFDDPEYNLYGSSYGTKIALELMRRKDNTVQKKLRSIILESVYPTDVHRTLNLPFVLNQAINHVFDYCKATPTCIINHPDLKQAFQRFLRELRTYPRRYLVSDPSNPGNPIEVVLNDQRLINSIFAGLYDARYYLPLLADAITGNNESVLINLLQYYAYTQLDQSFFDAVYFSVECADQPRYDRQQYNRALNQYPGFRSYLVDIPIYDVCADWPVSHALQLPDAVTSELPTLILSGLYDPVTPKEWAIAVSQQLANSQHFIVPDTGHSVMSGSQCIQSISRQFLDQPGQTVDRSCLPAIKAPIKLANPLPGS